MHAYAYEFLFSIDLLMYSVISMMNCLSRFWMDHFPEDFKRSSPLIVEVSALQEAMKEGGDDDLLELITSDTL